MTGNGIESDFVLPDSLFISDYSTLPSFYPHFGANCRFFCTISMSPDSSALFCSPNAARGAASGLRQRVFDPLDSRSRDSVDDTLWLCPRVYPMNLRFKSSVGVCTAKGSRGRPQTSSVFIAPLSPPQRRNPCNTTNQST